MRTTLILDDLLNRAKEETGIQEKTALVHAGLKALLSEAARKRLARLGGSQPDFETPFRTNEVILIDTSIWVEHFRKGIPRFSKLLNEAAVCTHPFVIGELACGNLKNRSQLLSDLHLLPSAQSVKDDAVLEVIERRKLWGRGLSWTDMHLLTSALLAGCTL